MKKMSVVFVLILFTVIVTGCTNSILENSETGNLGPAWDTTMKLPVADSSNNFGDLVGITEFDEFGFKVIENANDENDLEFFVTGTVENPIHKTQSVSLPYLKIDRNDYLFSFDTEEENLPPIPIVPGNELNKSIPIPFPLPGIKFASDSADDENNLRITVRNDGSNKLDSFSVLVKTNNNKTIDEINFTNIDVSGKDTKNIDLSGEKIESDKLNMVLSHNQSGDGLENRTEIHLEILGPEDMSIEKVDGLDAKKISLGNALNTSVELGELAEVEAIDGGFAKIDFKISPPSSTNLKFDFDKESNASYYIKLGGEKLTYKSDKDIYTTGKKTTPIGLDTLELSGGAEFSGDTFSYDANDELGIEISIVGQNRGVPVKEFIDTGDLPLEVKNNDLVYESDPMEVEISKDNIDTLKKHILSKDSFLETKVENGMDIEIKADIYLGITNVKEDLYIDDNKVNESLVEIRSGDSDLKRFSLGDPDEENSFLNMIDEAVENGNKIYLGIEFLMGDIDSDDFVDGEKSYPFSDEDIIDIKSHLEITVKVNQ